MERSNTHAIILGGGPAGLAAGKVLTDAGVRATVIEKDSDVGGLCRTHNHQGFLFDLGGHRFFTKKVELDQFLFELLGDELITVSRSSRIFFRDKYFNYPPTFLNAFRGMGPWISCRIMASFLYDRWRYRHRDVVSLEDWLVRQFGRRMYEVFFKTYTEKVWGVPCDQISAAWASQRIKGMSLIGTIKESVRLSEKNRPVSLIGEFKYPRRCIGRICERLSQQIQQRSEVRLQAQAVGILHEAGQVKGVRIRHKNGEEEVLRGTHVVSSIPVTELIAILDPPVPPQIREAAGKLRYRDLLVAVLFFDQDRITDDTWVYVPDPDVKFGRIHEPRNWSPDMSPPGKTSLVFEYFCFESDPIWGMKDSDIADMTLKDFVRLRLAPGKESLVFDHCVVRAKKAYPLQAVGHEEPLAMIKSYLKGIGNLHLIGRYGQFVYNNVDHSIETGIHAARRILGTEAGTSSSVSDDYLEIKREE